MYGYMSLNITASIVVNFETKNEDILSTVLANN
jgi:hypothetical protein